MALAAEAFPDSSVKRVLEEAGLCRTDDYIIHVLQTELLSMCISQNLKTAIAHCAMNQRKFLNEKDVTLAHQVHAHPMPFKGVTPVNAPHFLRSESFKTLCEEHIPPLVEVLTRFDHTVTEIKMSKEVALFLQDLVERHIREVLSHFASQVTGSSFGYRQYIAIMEGLIGHSLDA